MNFVSFSKHIVINFVMLTHTLIIIKLRPLLDLFISMAGLCELIYLVIIAHNLTHISTTFLDAAILVTGTDNTGRLISFPSLLIIIPFHYTIIISLV